MKVKNNKAIVFLSGPDFYEIGDNLSIKDKKGNIVGSASLLKIRKHKGIIEFKGKAGKGYEIVQKYSQTETKPQKSFSGKGRRDAFFELNARSMLVFTYGAFGLGYKAELGSSNYFGYLSADVNIGIFVILDPFSGIGDELAGGLGLEYGYEFMRNRLFSFGFNISPFSFLMRDLHKIAGYFEGEEDKTIPFYHYFFIIGIFGNFNISDSFSINTELKGIMKNPLINSKDRWMIPIAPLLEIKVRYYFW